MLLIEVNTLHHALRTTGMYLYILKYIDMCTELNRVFPPGRMEQWNKKTAGKKLLQEPVQPHPTKKGEITTTVPTATLRKTPNYAGVSCCQAPVTAVVNHDLVHVVDGQTSLPRFKNTATLGGRVVCCHVSLRRLL